MKLSIGTKFSLSFAAIVVFFIGLTYVTLNNTKKAHLLLSETYINIDKQSYALNSLRSYLLELEINTAKIAVNNSVIKSYSELNDALNKADSLLLSIQLLTSKLPDSLINSQMRLNESVATLLSDYHTFQKNNYKTTALKDESARIETLPIIDWNSNIHQKSNKIVAQLAYQSQILSRICSTQNNQALDILNKTKNYYITGGIAFIVLIIILAFISIHSLMRAIRYINHRLTLMGKGVLPNEILPEGNDELGQMARKLNSLVDGLQKISLFANEMGKGNFESKFEPLSDKDTLGNALISMREELKQASNEEAKRKEEDQQRNWSSQGIARFSEILRENNNNVEDLAFNIISNLVKYVGANQGGFFTINDSISNEIVYEMSACYAYDRKKHIHKRYAMGEGLIGRCTQEQESIFLTEIPKGYTEITSGLGNDDPTCLFIVPLKANEQVLGAIELASFEVLQPYQLEFIEKIAESIASTIASVKINIQTKLLLEQSRQHAANNNSKTIE